MGVGSGDHVVVYDGHSEGMMASARVWWMFRVSPLPLPSPPPPTLSPSSHPPPTLPASSIFVQLLLFLKSIFTFT